MPEKFRNTYRTATTRIAPQHYLNGYFFVTICTTGKRCFFGNITDENMELSGIGVIARDCLIDIPDHFPNVFLHEYVVMPNHVHCILNLKAETLRDTETLHATSLPNRNSHTVQTLHATSLRETMSGISPASGSLAAIIRSYKSAVTKHARTFQPDFAWQSRYHDHIIRNVDAYNHIAIYINNNILQWHLDEMFK